MPGSGKPPAMLCCMPGVAFVPALLVSWSSAAFIISYVIAVLAGHVEPLVPYISDTGTKPPESGIFGFMINISALLGAITMYIRYLLVEKQNELSHFVRSSCNIFSLCIGLMGCIGMEIVATFQELSVPSVHDIGALVAFGSGVVYITLQSIISYKSCPRWNTYFVCHVRMAISVVSCIAFIPMIVFASQISMTKIDWTPGEKDYTYHFLSAICEWTVAFGFIFFFLTFIRDFQEVFIASASLSDVYLYDGICFIRSHTLPTKVLEGLLEDLRVFGVGELIPVVYNVLYRYALWKKLGKLESLFFKKW